MGAPRRGQAGLHGQIAECPAGGRRLRERHRQHGGDRALLVAAAEIGERPAEHPEPAAPAHEFLDLVEVRRRQVGLRGEVVEDEEVEIRQLLEENLLGGERDEAQILLRDVDGVGGRAQDDERDDIETRVALEGAAEEAVAPARVAGDEEHPDLVAHRLDRQLGPVVVGDLLAILHGQLDDERIAARGRRRPLEHRPQILPVGRQDDRLRDEHLLAALEQQRHAAPGEAAGAQEHAGSARGWPAKAMAGGSTEAISASRVRSPAPTPTITSGTSGSAESASARAPRRAPRR